MQSAPYILMQPPPSFSQVIATSTVKHRQRILSKESSLDGAKILKNEINFLVFLVIVRGNKIFSVILRPNHSFYDRLRLHISPIHIREDGSIL